MPDYVIRGGEEGKARLHVIGAALASSTSAWLISAGIAEGMRCLDLGCGGGDVTLAMAEAVGPSGQVVGVDLDPVKIELARQDAGDRGLANVEFRVGDAVGLRVLDEYDLVYARLLLTHLRDPLVVLERMVGALQPGGVLVVEDMDHSALFSSPRCAALDRYKAIYQEVARQRGGDPEIGPKLPKLLRRVRLVDVSLHLAQPIFMEGEAKRICQITLDNIREPVVAAGLATEDELDGLAAEMDDFASDPTTMVAFPRIYQVAGRRPASPR
jgi:ubiquinone/menaquinone biosynthesis C-methylase UbiE